jgi:hypothetical protein
MEFVGFQRGRHFHKVTDSAGRLQEVRGVVGIIRYPDDSASVSTADEAIAAARKLLSTTSEREVLAKLQSALAMWTRARALAAQRAATEQAGPHPKPHALKFLDLDSAKYKQVSLSNFKDGVVTIVHSEGVARIAISKLSAGQVTALNTTTAETQIAAVPAAVPPNLGKPAATSRSPDRNLTTEVVEKPAFPAFEQGEVSQISQREKLPGVAIPAADSANAIDETLFLVRKLETLYEALCLLARAKLICARFKVK